MGYRYRRRKRRIRMTVSLILLAFSCIFLVSCMANANVTWVRGMLGYDVTDYEGEEIVATLSVDDVRAEALCDMVRILSADRGIHLACFSTTDEAVAQYRDAVLSYMLRQNYSRYTGNQAELAAAAEQYPQMQLSTLIPEQDFENVVFRYFGGVRVKNANGALYSYLKRAGCYTAPLQGRVHQTDILVLSLEETANTYRMQLQLREGDACSGTYTAVFVKRDDGSAYFRSLSQP